MGQTLINTASGKQNHWAIVCPDSRVKGGLWKKWLAENCVAIGWPPDKYQMRGPTTESGWELARKRVEQVVPGDVVIPYLRDYTFGIPGTVIRVAAEDSDWQPTVAAGNDTDYPDEATLGRRIEVKWFEEGVPSFDQVALAPKKMQRSGIVIRQAIEPLNRQRFADIMRIVRTPGNWRPYRQVQASVGNTSSKTTPEKIRAGKGKSKQRSGATSVLAGDSLYVQRAREAFPLLVRQAIARQKLFYSALADEMGMPNPRNLNYVLGAIGNAIKSLSVEWVEDIPPLQCLVVNKSTGLPGEGVAWFISGFKDFKNQTAEQQKLIVGVELARIFTYPKWDKVLAAFDLKPLKPVISDAGLEALIAKARNMRGTGEGEDHKKLKNYIAANPHVIDLPGFGKGQTEQPFTSADKIDIVFRKNDHWVGVEVKGPSSSEADLLRGLFQAVKYAALREAELKVDPVRGKNDVILVMSAKLSDELKKVKNLLGVTVLDAIVAPEEGH
jgi:hypothetical protein